MHLLTKTDKVVIYSDKNDEKLLGSKVAAIFLNKIITSSLSQKNK